jgi:hypothetical protein
MEIRDLSLLIKHASCSDAVLLLDTALVKQMMELRPGLITAIKNKSMQGTAVWSWVSIV